MTRHEDDLRTAIRLDEGLKADAERCAESRGVAVDGFIRQAIVYYIARSEAHAENEGRDEEWRNEWRKAEDAWRRLSTEDRENLLLHALGDERLTIDELASRVNAELGHPDGRDESGRRNPCAVYDGKLRAPVKRMVSDGRLDRAAERFKNKLRYRYSRKRGLDGPIAELERAYHEGD